MRPERVMQRPCKQRRRTSQMTLTIHAFHVTYAHRVYRRTLHPSYIPWVQAVFHPVLSRYLVS